MSENLFSRTNRRARGRRGRPIWRKILDYALAACILLGLVVLAARLDEARKITRSGQPIVNDGDSLTINGDRIRLWGIDAPEFNQSCTSQGTVYPCGRQSRAALQEMTRGRSVDCHGAERDRYDRLLAICLADGIELNRAMVESGWALAYGGYEAAQANARAGRKGLWAGEFERPRDWRQQREHGRMPTDSFLSGIGDTVRKWLSSLFDG